uniref:Uncharacterized protein n=1 Tax=Periophthalmus magnuspinnatus TaxID=409849 RepID=A0A3B3Z9Y9_9GOBI
SHFTMYIIPILKCVLKKKHAWCPSIFKKGIPPGKTYIEMERTCNFHTEKYHTVQELNTRPSWCESCPVYHSVQRSFAECFVKYIRALAAFLFCSVVTCRINDSYITQLDHFYNRFTLFFGKNHILGSYTGISIY